MMSMMKNTAPTSVAPNDAPIAIGPVEALTHTASQRRQLLVALEGAAARADWTLFTQGREAIAHEIKVLGYVAESVHPH